MLCLYPSRSLVIEMLIIKNESVEKRRLAKVHTKVGYQERFENFDNAYLNCIFLVEIISI